MAIVISGTTGIDAGSLPVSNCGNTEVEGNLNLSGVGARITGDFSNATYSNRIAFQTNAPNTYTTVAAIPNGTGAYASFQCYSSSDMNNSTRLHMGASTNLVEISSSPVGTASYVPLVFSTGGTERMRIDTAGNIGIGITPSINHTGVNMQIGVAGAIRSNNGTSYISVMSNSAGGKFINNDYAAVYEQVTGAHYWYTSGSSGTAGTTIPWSSAMVLDTSGNLVLTKGTGGLGYGTGAGGTVTQLTSKSTAVTLNKPSGQITMNNAALAAGATAEFALNNTLININDIVSVQIIGASQTLNYSVQAVTSGTNGVVYIQVKNITAGSLSQSVQLQFNIIKGAIA